MVQIRLLGWTHTTAFSTVTNSGSRDIDRDANLGALFVGPINERLGLRDVSIAILDRAVVDAVAPVLMGTKALVVIRRGTGEVSR